MALAEHLNELATANLEGLLSDDEYRLLRQNLFEQYSGNMVIPVESPIVPTARVRVQLRGGSSPTPNQRRATPKVSPDRTKPPPSPTRAKIIVTSGVSNLLRRATGRRTPDSLKDLPTTTNTRKDDGVNRAPNDALKRSILIPRFHKKKPSQLPPLRKEVPRPLTDAVNSSKLLTIRTADEHRNPPPSPTPSSRHFVPPPSPLHPEKSISTIRDVFDDDSLRTAKDIRNAIAFTEHEGRRLVEAFNNLECTTIRRIQKQNARRLPATTPANINILLGGKEWREHRLISSPSSPLFDSRPHHILSSVETNSDRISICSGSSNMTSLSRSKSISSLRPPVSPFSPQFCTHSAAMPRKDSVSSLSSQSPSCTSAGLWGVTNSSSPSKSTSHLALRRLKDSQLSTSTETVGQVTSDRENGDEDAELSDIRKRREDLVSRYTARLEFLRAKLKGAELHEKLLRK